MPTPRTSISPCRGLGAVAIKLRPRRARCVWSSAISRPPASISRRARSDLPAPEGPRSKMHRQRPLCRSAALVACTKVILPGSPAHSFTRRGGNADREACAQHAAVGGTPVGGADRAAIGLHDLPADREAEPRVLAEMLGGTLGVEALEDRFEVLLRNAAAFVVDCDDERAAARLAGQFDDDVRIGRTEGERIVDDIAQDLAIAAVVAMRAERRIGADAQVDG